MSDSVTKGDSEPNGLRNVIVIGSGPAGYTAAIYLARAELQPLVFAGEKWGGQLMLTTEVENYPGFPEGVIGPKLMDSFRQQAKRFGAEVVDKDVTWVDFKSQPFKVGMGLSGEDKQSKSSSEAVDKHSRKQSLSTINNCLSTVYQARAVIIATGAESKLTGVPGEREFMGKGVSTCAVCDAPFYKGKNQVFVVGGGDAAIEEALALAKYAKAVTVIHRRDTLRASKIMQRKAQQAKNINFLWNSELQQVKGQDKATSIVVKNNKTGKIQELAMDGIFIAIGHKPVTEIFKGEVDLDEKGYVKTGLTYPSIFNFQSSIFLEGYPTMTSVAGVFGAGDVVDFHYRQAVTAAGFGCMAALDVEKWLQAQGVEVGQTVQY